ncbi:MAG: hypothetical protein PHT73_05180 [bacterium]|nr:hypothetical protein [bacterium]
MATYDHDRIAMRLARKFNAVYSTHWSHKGPDIQYGEVAIAVETVDNGISTKAPAEFVRVVGKKRYIAVPDDEWKIKLAKQAVDGTGIGVMDENGEILVEARKLIL